LTWVKRIDKIYYYHIFYQLEWEMTAVCSVAERHHSIGVKSGSCEIVVPIRRVPIALARRLFQICTAVAAEALVPTDLTPLEYAVIAYLSEEPDIDQAGLAARLGIDRTSTGLLLDQLEAKGLVSRRVNGADRRARLSRLTVLGTSMFKRLGPKARAAQKKILATLTAREEKLLINLLVRVIQANKSYARPGAGRRKRVVRL
jgi:DNA-binding MarR family transcriptional regulator